MAFRLKPKLVKNMEMAQEVFNRLADPTQKEIVYDSETNGLDYRNSVIVGHVITFGRLPQDTYYVPVRHGGGGNVLPYSHEHNDPDHDYLLEHPFETEFSKYLLDPSKHWIGHHFMFDLRMLARHNLRIAGRVEDTEVNAAILNEFQSSYSLDMCCRVMNTEAKKGDDLYKHLAMKFGGTPDRRSQMGNYWKLAGDDAIGFDYAAGDGTSTWDLLQAQRAKIEQEGMAHIRMLESDITRVVYRMTTRGVRIDKKNLDATRQKVADQIKKASKVLPKDFNPNAPSQMKEFLKANGVNEDQWDYLPPTEAMVKKGITKGNPSFNEAFLSRHECGKAVLVMKKLTHLENSFLGPMAERHIWPDGRCRATFNQTANDDFGTVTYRFSCNDPNLQQNHKRNQVLGELSRASFVPDEGDEWTDADLSQCEPRLLAHYSEAKALVKGFNAVPFVDAHQAVATAADIDRESGKRLNQTLITGGGKDRVIEMLGSQGAQIYDAYFKALPEIKTLQQQSKRVFERRGYLLSLLRRRARLERREKSYKGVNRILQVSNADVIKKAMVDIDKHYEENGDIAKLLNTVHDSLSTSAPPTKRGREIVEYGLRLMTDFGPGRTVEMKVPMAADYARGKNWAEATYNKKGRIVVGDDPNDPWYAAHKRS